MTQTLRIALTVSTIALAALLAMAPEFPQNPVRADAPMSNDQLKALYEEKCSACHDAYDPEEKGYTLSQWQSTVDRMMNVHNARASITNDQAALIVSYLGEFAPKPGQGVNNGIGIWQTDPAQSVSYPFTYGPNLQAFDIHGGQWKVIQTPEIFTGYLKTFNAVPQSALIVENKDNFQGALDAQVQFQVTKGSPFAAVGILFGATDAQNYLAAEFTSSTGNITLVQVTDGVPATLQQSTVASSQVASTSTWHDLRVKVSLDGAKLEIWTDYQKQLSARCPNWTGGRVGILSSGPITASFRQLTIDSYEAVQPSPAGDVMLH